MITRNLKWVDFEYLPKSKIFTIAKVYEDSSGGMRQTLTLTKSEAGALSRFIFSTFQYHSNKRKHG